jgi:hypothetical protein
MARIVEFGLKRHLSGKAAASLALSACLVLGAFVASAGAQPRRDDHRGGDRHFDHRDDRGRGYYAPPPVVYGGPAYYPPPVVYGPTIGINLPGVSIGIQ